MQIIPAIDIFQGKVVRLLKGNFQAVTEYSDNPIQIAKMFSQAGFDHLHLIDLSGAKEGKNFIEDLLPDILGLGVTLQVGGGIRTFEVAERYINAGVDRVIVSTAALLDQNFYQQLIKAFGANKILVSLDVDQGKIAIKGWKTFLEMTLQEVVRQYNLTHCIITDISKDGTLSGVDLGLYQELMTRHPNIELIAAGGIASLDTIIQLENIGIKGVIVGRAFYEDEYFRNEIFDYIKTNRLG